MSRRTVLVGVVTTLLAVVSCDSSDPVGPSTTTQLDVADLQPQVLRDPNAVIVDGPSPRFELTPELVGPAELGAPITLRLITKALTATAGLEVRAVMPELQVAVANDGRMVDYTGNRLDPLLRASASLSNGQTRADLLTVQIPYPGYWRVVVTAEIDGRVERARRGPEVSDVVHGELWLYMDGNSVRTSSTFDEALFPDTIVPAPGPFHYRSDRTRSGVGPQTNGPARAVENTTFRVIYYNSDTSQYDPVAGALFKGTYYLGGEPFLGSEHVTDNNGYFNLACNTNYDYYGELRFERDEFTIGPDVSTVFYGCQPGWDDPDVFVASSIKGQVWRNLSAAVDAAGGMFSQSRPILPVTVTTSTSACPTATACYFSGSDEIKIESAAVWGVRGVFVAAHEYGHAFHEEALGGNEGSGTCGGPHYLFAAHNLPCAFSEGFADFFGALTNQDLLPNDSLWEDAFERPHYEKSAYVGLDDGYWCNGLNSCPQTYQQTKDGGRAELAVAAFLYDLADNNATANYQPTSDDDAVAYGPQYVADVVETCQVRQNSVWVRANGLDHLIYCF